MLRTSVFVNKVKVCNHSKTSNLAGRELIQINCQALGGGEDPAQQREAEEAAAVLRPQLSLSKEEAIVAQIKALQHNNFPYTDHGIEVLYRFANFSPWERSHYFGRSLDLGQFERFRRIFYTSCYSPLLGLTKYEFLSSLELSEESWRARILVTNDYRKEERTYEFTMKQRVGGRYDGVWFCHSLICDGCDDKQIMGII